MPLVRRRPLLRAVAVGGGAYHLGKRRRQAEQQEGEAQPAASEVPSPESAGGGPTTGVTEPGADPSPPR